MKPVRQSYRLAKWLAAATAAIGRHSERFSAIPGRILWFTPWEVPVSERGRAKQARWLRDTKPHTFRSLSGSISAFSAGSGPVVLLVHGWGESAATLGGFIEPLTRAGYRVIGIDLPGHGGSSGRTTNIIDSGNAIAAIAEEIGGVDSVVAHSMGANVTLWAMKHGLALRRAVLLAPNVDLAYAFASFQEMFSLPPKAVDGLKRSIERRFGSSVWTDIRGDELARDVDVPALVFHDPEDPVVPFAGAQRLAAVWSAAELVEVPGRGHGTITRDPEVIERSVGFLKVPTRAGADVSSSLGSRNGTLLQRHG